MSNSTITRELRRNSTLRGGYKWKHAQRLAARRRGAAPGNRSVKPHVRAMAIRLLRHEQWSPEQISGYLARNGIGISHETIYAIVRKDKMEGGILYTYCRHRLRHRHRPVGKKLRWGKDAKELARAAIALLAPYRGHIRSITTDNGLEFSCHRLTARALATTVYFTDPYASWQKGAVENANGLVRQYVPKASDIRRLRDEDIDRIADKINDRLRKNSISRHLKKSFSNFCRKFTLAC